MMGLLDQMDPQQMALLAMAGGLLTPPRQGGGMGAAVQGLLSAQAAGQQRRLQERQMSMEDERMGMQREQFGLQQRAGQQQLDDAQRKRRIDDEIRRAATESVTPPTMDYAADGMGPPEVGAGGFDSDSFLSKYQAIDPLGAFEMGARLRKDSPFDKVDAAKFTPESVAEFARSRNHSVLRPRPNMQIAPNGQAVDMNALQPGQNFGKPEGLGQRDTGSHIEYYDPRNPSNVFTRVPKQAGPQAPQQPVYDSRLQSWITPQGTANPVRAPDGSAPMPPADPAKLRDAETGLRKEFDDKPEVKRYGAALPAFRAIMEASNRNTPQADINLVYGIAKLYDPDSVVREGEYATIANSQAIPEKIKGEAQRLMGGGRLTPTTKAELRREAEGRIRALEDEYEKAAESYSDIASRSGANVRNVLGDRGRFRTLDIGGQSVRARQAPDGQWYVKRDGKHYKVEGL